MKRARVRADGFYISECNNPECGLHFTSVARSGQPICEFVIALRDIPDVINTMQAAAYRKVTEIET